MSNLKNTSVNMMLINIVLHTFCTKNVKLKSGHLGPPPHYIISRVSTSKLFLGNLLLRQKNHGAEVGGLGSYQLLAFGEQKALVLFSVFFPIPVRTRGGKTKGDGALVNGSEEQGMRRGTGLRGTNSWVCWFDL